MHISVFGERKRGLLSLKLLTIQHPPSHAPHRHLQMHPKRTCLLANDTVKSYSSSSSIVDILKEDLSLPVLHISSTPLSSFLCSSTNKSPTAFSTLVCPRNHSITNMFGKRHEWYLCHLCDQAKSLERATGGERMKGGCRERRIILINIHWRKKTRLNRNLGCIIHPFFLSFLFLVYLQTSAQLVLRCRMPKINDKGLFCWQGRSQTTTTEEALRHPSTTHQPTNQAEAVNLTSLETGQGLSPSNPR